MSDFDQHPDREQNASREECIQDSGHIWPLGDDDRPQTCKRCGYNPGWVPGTENLEPTNSCLVCECCERDQRPEEQDWVVGHEGEDLCALCAESLLSMEREAVEKLPERIGLCPEHAPEFYYPLKDDEGLVCPTCSREMVVYVKSEHPLLTKEDTSERVAR